MTQLSAAPGAAAAPRALLASSTLVVAVGIAWLGAGVGSLLEAFGEATPWVSSGLRAVAALCVMLLLLGATEQVEDALRPGFRLLTIGVGAWAAAGLLQSGLTAVGVEPAPGWWALVYLTCGLLFTAGTLLLGRGRVRKIELVHTIADGLLVAAAVCLVWWKFFDLDLNLSAESLTATARTGSDAMFVTAASMVWSRSDRRIRRTSGLIALSAVVLFTTDLVYLSQHLLTETETPSRTLAVGWSVAIGLLGLAALDVNRPPLAKERSAKHASLQQTGPLLAVLAVVTAIAADDHLDTGSTVPVIVFCAVALGLAARQVMVARDNGRLHDELTARANDLERLAATDELTGLWHRRVLIERTTQALHARRLDGAQVGLVFVDLDGFKRINDRLGHAVGDRVLQVVAERLLGHAAPDDTVARFGGDEFAILRARADVGIESWADEVRQLLSGPIDLTGTRLRVTSSVGLVCADGSYADAERMLGDADLAMYRAKREGSNQTAHFTLSLREAATDRARSAADLQIAIAEQRLVVHYQPVFDLRDGRAVGAEALVRLDARDRGLVPPGEFLPLAQTLGLMPEITQIVLDTACRDFAGTDLERDGWWVSVNLDATAILDPQLGQQVSDVLTRTGLPARRLVIEVSEQTLPESALAVALFDLAATGVRVALDDFGSGWSSFAQLRALPLDMVKLDRDLTAELASGSAAALFRAVVALASELDLTVIAEGIEEPAQPRLVRDAGCHLGQGYRWGMPSTLDDLLDRWAS